MLWSGALSVVSVQEGNLLMTKGMVYDAVIKEANFEGLVAWDRRFQLLTRRGCWRVFSGFCRPRTF